MAIEAFWRPFHVHGLNWQDRTVVKSAAFRRLTWMLIMFRTPVRRLWHSLLFRCSIHWTCNFGGSQRKYWWLLAMAIIIVSILTTLHWYFGIYFLSAMPAMLMRYMHCWSASRIYQRLNTRSLKLMWCSMLSAYGASDNINVVSPAGVMAWCLRYLSFTSAVTVYKLPENNAFYLNQYQFLKIFYIFLSLLRRWRKIMLLKPYFL